MAVRLPLSDGTRVVLAGLASPGAVDGRGGAPVLAAASPGGVAALLGMTAAAAELAVGVLCGLYEIRDPGSDSLLEYAPDYAIDQADHILRECAKAGIDLPVDDLLDLIPEWSMLVTRPTRQAPSHR